MLILSQVCHYEQTTLINHTNFPSYSCWFCYKNLVNRLKIKSELETEKHDCGGEVPHIKINEKCAPFDLENESIKRKVQKSLSNDGNLDKSWRNCCRKAEDCCKDLNKTDTIENFDETCDGYWDKDEEFCYEQTVKYKSIPSPCLKDDISPCQCKFLLNFLQTNFIKFQFKILKRKNVEKMQFGRIPTTINVMQPNEFDRIQYYTFPF